MRYLYIVDQEKTWKSSVYIYDSRVDDNLIDDNTVLKITSTDLSMDVSMYIMLRSCNTLTLY